MKIWYDKGFDLGQKTNRSDCYYPLSNRLAAEIALSWIPSRSRTKGGGKKKGPDPIAEGLDILEQYAKEFVQKGNSFWDMSVKPDWLLLDSLYKQRMTPEAQKDILKGYREAKRRGGSAKEMDAVFENIRFFEAMLEPPTPPRVRQQLGNSLKTLRENLGSMTGTT